MRYQALAILAAIPVLASAQAADKRTPLEKYQGAYEFRQMMCPLALRLANLQVETGRDLTPEEREKGDYRKCISEGKAELKSAYEAALKSIKKPAAKNALKEHFIAATVALGAIQPESDERKLAYEKRQIEHKDKVAERWARFEVEN